MKKNILILLAMLIAMVGLSSIVYGANPTCTIAIPASNTAYNGTVHFSATITSNGTGSSNVSGINFTVSSVVVGSNITGGQNMTTYGASVDTSTITDIKQTTVTANIIVNGSLNGVLQGSCTSTGVDFDNTNPVCNLDVDREIIEVGDPLEIDCSDSTDTTDLTYSVTFCTEGSSVCTTETPSNGIAQFEESETFGLGQGQAGCIVTDEVSKTNACTNISITVKGSEGGEDSTTTTEEEQEKENNALLVIGIIVVIVIVILLAFFLMTSKKKKR